MLLYAIYTPDKITSWSRERVYAFASIERCVTAMRHINEQSGDRGVCGGGSGSLRLVTREEALQESSIATLCTDSMTFSGPLVNIQANGIQDSWDGSWTEIQLVENMEDENIPSNPNYA